MIILPFVIAVATVLMQTSASAGSALPARNVPLELNLKALAEPLQDLTPAEREVVDETIQLIQQKQHALALVNLTGLTASNPSNSALRVLRAYVLLELGNVTGALGDARIAEASGLRSAYRCWFLARVAYLAGNKPLCRREIGHIASDPTYGPEATKLRRGMETKLK